MKSKANKKFASVLGTFEVGETATVETLEEITFHHDDGNAPMVSHVLEAAKAGQHVIQVLSDDTGVGFFIVY